MRVAVTGTTGRLGAALARHFASHHEVIPLPRPDCDLADPQSLARALDGLDCDVLLNPAGLTSLETCEDDPALAMRVNAGAPGEIAAWAAARGVPVFHYSTDYVFDGREPGLKKEEDPPSPLSVYGRSKLAGEQAVLAWPGNCVIRVSWVFGPEKPSFVDQIIDNALSGTPLAAIADKLSLPGFTTDLAAWTETLVSKNATGIIHACNSGEPVSWHGMGQQVLREMLAAGAIATMPEIEPLQLSSVKAFRAERPRFTAMDTTRLETLLGETPRPWPDAIAAHVHHRLTSI